MKSVFSPIIDSIKHLNIIRYLPDYFDPQERRQVFQSIIIGFAVWFVVFTLKSAVHVGFEAVLHWVEENPWRVFIPLILGAVVVSWITRTRASVIHYKDAEGKTHDLNDVEGDGLERAISLYYSSEPALEKSLTGKEGVDLRWELPTFSLAIRKFLATLVTLTSGGSGGLEASVALIGESVSSGLFKPRRVVETAEEQIGLVRRFWRWWQSTEPDDLQTAQLGGIAAAVSTLLGAPFAAAFFAVEVMYRRRPIIEKLIYALIPSLIAYFLTNIFSGGHTAIFEVETIIKPPTSLNYYLILLLVAALISLVGMYFARMRISFDEWFHKLPFQSWQRHALGASITGVIALIVLFVTQKWFGFEDGLALVLGPGEGPIHAALLGELTIAVALIALFAKLLATLATIASGGSAGLLVPSIFFGSMVASAVAPLVEVPAMALVIPAMAASLVSIVNVPLAATLFIVEVFGAPYLLPALIMLVVTSILAHENSIYRTQRLEFDSRQIFPGYSVRRIHIPEAWAGKTIVSLRIRNTYQLNVIGIVEHKEIAGHYLPQVRIRPDTTTLLKWDNVLVVLGEDDRLDQFEAEIEKIRKQNPP